MRCYWLAGVLGLAACGGDDVESVELGVSWTLLEGSDGEEPVLPCPALGELEIRVEGDTNTYLEVPCSDTGAATVMVPPGSYDVSITVYSDDAPVASSDIEQVEVGAAGAAVDFEFPTLWGFVTLAWRLEDDTGTAITCDDAGAFEVLIVTVTEANVTTGSEIDCDDGASGPLAVDLGDYFLCAALRDVDGNVIGNPFEYERSITHGNQTDEIGERAFQVPPDEQGPTGLCGSFGP